MLESFKIMDYSLLIGIHNIDQERRDKGLDKPDDQQPSCSRDYARQGAPEKSNMRQKKNKWYFNSSSNEQTLAPPKIDNESMGRQTMPIRRWRGLSVWHLLIFIINHWNLFQIFDCFFQPEWCPSTQCEGRAPDTLHGYYRHSAMLQAIQEIRARLEERAARWGAFVSGVELKNY